MVPEEDPTVCFSCPSCTTQKTKKYLLTSKNLKSSLTNQPCVLQIGVEEFAATIMTALGLQPLQDVNEALDIDVTLIKEVEKLP